MQLSQGELDLVLSQVKATHERFENGRYYSVQKIELIMPKVANRNQNSYKTKYPAITKYFMRQGT